MAQRGAPLAKGSTAARKNPTGESLGLSAEESADLRPIPLDLGPLIAPYKKRGRLSIRIEGLPPAVRFSAGRNNGNSSWSFATDELEDLIYFLPEKFHKAHTLTLRVISVADGSANVLAALDLPVTPELGGIDTDATAESGSDQQIGALRDELAKATALLASRDSELKEAIARAEQAQSENPVREALAKTEQAWKAESASQLAAAEAQWKKQSTKALADVTAQLKAAEAALASERAQSKAAEEASAALKRDRGPKGIVPLNAKLVERDTVSVVGGEVKKVREDAQTQIGESLAKAERAWKAKEDARFTAAEAKWTEQAAAAIAEVTARLRAAEVLTEKQARDAVSRDEAVTLERNRLHKEIASLNARIAERDTTLARADAAVEQARSQMQMQMDDALAKAERTWKVKEDARFAAAETQWKERSSTAIADMTARLDAAEATALEKQSRDQAAHDEAAALERNQLHKEIASLKAVLVEHEASSAQADVAAAQVRGLLQAQMEDALAEARRDWKANEDARFIAAETQWKERSSVALAEITARLRAAEAALTTKQAHDRASHDEAATLERDSLRKDIATLKATLAERDAGLAQARATADQAVDEFKAQMDEALAKAERTWKAKESVRFATAEAEWREASTADLAELTARLKKAEAELAYVGQRAAAEHPSGDDARIQYLQAALDQAQTTLAERERELSHAQAMQQAAQIAPARETQIRLRTNQDFDDYAPRERIEPQRPKNNVVRDFLIAIGFGTALAATATVVYPKIEIYLPYSLRSSISSLTDQMTSRFTPATVAEDSAAPQAAIAVEPATPEPAKPQMTEVVSSAKLRSGPSTDSKAIVTLSAGRQVTIVERNGNWTRVQIADTSGKTEPKQGWIHNTLLKEAPESPLAASPAKSN